jgi:hypothetical protein
MAIDFRARVRTQALCWLLDELFEVVWLFWTGPIVNL